MNDFESHIGGDIPFIKFACDLKVCKGGCCTMPGPRGAPLSEKEIPLIQRYAPIAQRYIAPDHRDYIQSHGIFQGVPGDFTTQVFRNTACVFVYYEDGIAKCSFEKAYLKKESDWIKPLSCHLFPIRIDGGYEQHLRYEAIAECEPALKRGHEGQIELIQFLKLSLIRAFGEERYNQILKFCETEKSLTQTDRE
ncbi:MAG: DUF3109 family protein [bacterium]